MNKKSNVAILVTLLFMISCNSELQNSSAINKTDTVFIKQMQFSPAQLKVNKGDTVIFINNDYVSHDVTNSSKEYYSDTIRVGSSWKLIPVNSSDYFCSIHPTMKGKIILNQ